MEALKYIIDFVKTCNLKMLYLVFGNEVNLRHLNFLISDALFTHFYDAIAFHSYEIYILMMLIEVPWFCIMIGGVLELFSCLNVKIITFELEKITFVVYLIVFSPCMLNL
jgi:ABC-type multidrug transport system permease subunit